MLACTFDNGRSESTVTFTNNLLKTNQEQDDLRETTLVYSRTPRQVNVVYSVTSGTERSCRNENHYYLVVTDVVVRNNYPQF